VVMSGVAQRFVRAFFDENPLSQLGILVLRNGVAERLSELSSSPVRVVWGGGGGGRVRPVPVPVACGWLYR
jgi:hypothetical protein